MKEFDSIEEAMTWAEEYVEDPCVDNQRCAFTSDPEAMVLYDQAKEDGCCGSFDEIVTIEGREAIVGCNYGH